MSKPLNKPAYGSIPHLPGSRLGPGDHHISPGQARIATEKTRDRNDIVIVQEKLDGSNVAVAKHNGQLLALTRRGYLATSSPFRQHHYFAAYVQENHNRFNALLCEGERICGEWLAMAHGTRYKTPQDPFVVFDLFTLAGERMVLTNFHTLVKNFDLAVPKLLHYDSVPCPVEKALSLMGDYGFHGAMDKAEGVVYRVERKGAVDFLCKYVRPDKKDGCYFCDDESKAVWNYDCSRWDNELTKTPAP